LRPYDTAFDRFAPVSPDHILGMDATPAPQSGAVLPSSCRDPGKAPVLANRLFTEVALDFPRFLDFRRRLATSRFSGPSRRGHRFGLMTCRVLRSAHHPCRLRATAHPDRLPSGIRNPILLSLVRVFLAKLPRRFCLTGLSSLAARLIGLCSHEHPDCDGPGYIVARL
jgi:hypothetical protein